MLWICILFGSTLILQPCDCSNSHLRFSARDGKGWGGGTDASTFFDIALTALAFLSFGIFLLNLLCNALLYPSLGTHLITGTDPIVTGAGSIITGGGGTGGPIITGGTGLGRRLRGRRALFTPEIDQVTFAKFLAAFVTNSIETMSKKYECTQRVFCEANRKSRLLSSGYKFIVPAVSFSISFIGKLLKLHNDLPAHINAIRLGMEEANCQSYFPKCG